MAPTHPQMKDSGVEWLGKVPEHWRLLPSKRVFKRKKDLNAGMKCENRLALTMTGVVRRSLDDLEGLQASEFGTYQIFHKDDLAFKLIDLQNIKTSRVGIVPDTGIMSPAYIRCEANKSQVMPKYGYWFFTNLYWQQVFNQLGGGVRQTIGPEELLDIPMLLPSLQEQAAIVSFLDRKTALIDDLIAKRERQIELLQERRTALISRAVTKGLNQDVPMKDSGVEWLGKVPGHWAVKALKWESPVFRGASPRPIDNQIYFDEKGEYAWVRISDVTSAGMYMDVTEQRLSDLGSSLSVKLEPGSFFLSIAGSVGKPCITRVKCCIHDGFVYFPMWKGSAKFLYYVFASGEPYKGLGKMGTQLNLNTDTVGAIVLGVPCVEEQDEIADYLDRETAKTDIFVTKVQQSIEKLREYRLSLISAAVTGKIDVRNWQPSSEPAEETLHA